MAGILIIGYGNPGRADDGLGPAFAEEIEKMSLKSVVVESDYQLSVEHAYDIAKSEVAILVDADTSCTEPFEIKKVIPSEVFSFSSHSVLPGSLATLTKDFSGVEKDIFLIGIRGYEFNSFKEELSDEAKKNLAKTVEALSKILKYSKMDELREKLNNMSRRTE
ncbi:MAG: hydrogenase maturation protease [Lentisphaerota bacterium]